MLPCLVALAVFYAFGYFYTAHPWQTVLKIWLWGWLICGVLNLAWALISNLMGKKDGGESGISPSVRFKTEIVLALVQSAFMLYWPGFIYSQLEDAWTNLAIRLGWREKPVERVFMRKENAKAVRETENTWQLEGESCLSGITIPNPPSANAATIVRVTHSNSYGPFDDVDLFVRIGNPDHPTDEFALNTASDWIKARLIEELVTIDDKELFRSEAREPFKDETPWEGTYEAELQIPSGRRSIEIKIISKHAELLESRVLADWEINVA